jgi:hypothetical protein
MGNEIEGDPRVRAAFLAGLCISYHQFSCVPDRGEIAIGFLTHLGHAHAQPRQRQQKCTEKVNVAQSRSAREEGLYTASTYAAGEALLDYLRYFLVPEGIEVFFFVSTVFTDNAIGEAYIRNDSLIEPRKTALKNSSCVQSDLPLCSTQSLHVERRFLSALLLVSRPCVPTASPSRSDF